MFELLVELGADVNCADNEGNTAVSLLLQHQYTIRVQERIKFLITAGFYLDKLSKEDFAKVKKETIVDAYFDKKKLLLKLYDNRETVQQQGKTKTLLCYVPMGPFSAIVGYL